MDQHLKGYELIVKGRISSVRWLEQPPYNAVRHRSGKYWNYHVPMLDPTTAIQLQRKLEGDQLAAAYRDDSLHVDTGVWVELVSIYDEAALEREAAAAQAARDAVPIYPGWLGFAELLRGRGVPASNDACRAFAEQQIEMLWRQLRDWRDQREVHDLLSRISLSDDEQAAAIYAKHKPRLQELAKKAKR